MSLPNPFVELDGKRIATLSAVLKDNPEIAAEIEAQNLEALRASDNRTDSDHIWPDPSPLGDELPPVQNFSLEFLPSSLRPLVEDLSERMQTPPDFW